MAPVLRLKDRFFLLGSLITVFLAVGCQTPEPTRVIETRIIHFDELSQQLKAPVAITDETVVIDVRPSFDFTMAHIPSSINLQWEEFAQVRGAVPGLVQSDLTRVAKRLALKGIGPTSQVVIVGKGLEGQGEEGRMAWTLFYLGVPKVQITDIKNFDRMLTNIESTPLQNYEDWKPQVISSVLADRKEVLQASLSRKDPMEKVHILDVRSKKEYFSKKGFGLGYNVPDIQAMHIEWKEFFTAGGQVKESMRNQLRGVGIGINDRILVISNRGVRSGAVTMALLALGFQRSANYAGGYTELLLRKR
ncbi:MAG: hypothetical protein KDD43_12010 [Bdellovibrionales bacterium]|nr:hypothetical protein [Bdellovibrionales bacterium]